MDIERMKVDESLWPEEAFGLWVVTEDGGRLVKTLFVHDPREGVVMDETQRAKYIPRPEPRQVEWDGEGLPPVGCECEAYHFEAWRKCEVVALRDGMVIYWVPGFYEQETGISISNWFRPIRTKEKREREELTDVIKDAVRLHLNETGISNLIYAAGWRKDQ